jgi:hypothetical protein
MGQPAVGSVGGRARSIARPRTASNNDANSRNAIESGSVNGKRRQLTGIRRARASAYSPLAKIFRESRAFGRVATSFSSSRMNIRTSVFVV